MPAKYRLMFAMNEPVPEGRQNRNCPRQGSLSAGSRDEASSLKKATAEPMRRRASTVTSDQMMVLTSRVAVATTVTTRSRTRRRPAEYANIAAER